MATRGTMARLGMLAAAGMGLASALAAAAPPFAEHNQNGQMLIPHEAHKGKGTMYYALPGRERQIFFESDAPLEKIKGRSNRVIGYAVAPTDGGAVLAGGEWHLPPDSLKTGIKLRDEHLAGKDWLDAESYPHIVFQLTEVRDAELVKQTDDFRTYSVTLVGDMTIHGVTKQMVISDSRVTFLKANERTAKFAEGDLLAIRTKYSVKLSDFGVSHPVIGEKVAEEVVIDTSLYLSTVPPTEQG